MGTRPFAFGSHLVAAEREMVVAMVVAMVATAAHAADSTWLAPVDGLFSDPSKWSAGVPGATDVAIFGPAAAPLPYSVTVGSSITLSGILVANQRTSLAPQEGVGVTVNGALVVGGTMTDTVDSTSLTLVGGTLQAANAVKVGCDGMSGVARVVSGLAVLGPCSIGCDGGRGEWQVTASGAGTAGLYLATPGSDGSPSVLLGVGGDGTIDISDDLSTGTEAVILSAASSVWSVGADGGSGVLNVRGGQHTLVGTMRFGGDGPGPRGAGSGFWTMEDADLTSPGVSITIGSEGLGMLQLAGDVKIGSKPIVLGADGGTGVLEVVGIADLPSLTVGRPASAGSIVVSGLGSELTSTTMTVDGGAGSFAVLDGAMLIGSIELKGGSCDIDLVAGGAALAADRLERFASAGSGVLRCDMGEGTAMLVGFLRAAAGPGGSAALEWFVGKNATVDVGQCQSTGGAPPEYLLELAPQSAFSGDLRQCGSGSTLRFLYADGQVPYASGHSCALRGRLEVVDVGSETPAPGTMITLVTSEALSQSFGAVITPVWHGYPAIMVWDDVSLGLLVVDHVDALEVPDSIDVWVGLERPLAITAVVDGESFDVTRQVEWEIDPELAALVHGTSLVGLIPGTITATVRFGAIERQVTLVVRDDVESIPFRLVDTLAGEWPSLQGRQGNDQGGAGLAERGSHLSYDGSSVIFATRYEWLIPSRFAQPTAFVKGIGSDGLTYVGTLIESIDDEYFLSTMSISRDGRYATFSSWDVIGESRAATSGQSKVYLLDRTTQAIEIISMSFDGGPVDRDCTRPEIAGDGRWVYFRSFATNILPDGEEKLHVYRRDRWTGLTERVTVDTLGAPLDGVLDFEGVTPDGRYVFFDRVAPNGNVNVWRKDLATGELRLISKDLQGSGETLTVRSADLSADGRFVAYIAESGAPIVEGVEPSDDPQIYLHDAETDEASLLSRDVNGEPINGYIYDVAIDDAGTMVAFVCIGDLGIGGASDRQRAWRLNRVTGAIDEVSCGVVGSFNDEVLSIDISGDGASVALSTWASNVLPFDNTHSEDVFVRRFDSAVLGDLDGDGTVNATDLAMLIGAWGSTTGDADLDADGVVGPADLAMLLGAWSSGPGNGG